MSIQQEKFKAIADKIRSILGTTDMIAPNDFTDKIDEVMARGIDEGVNRATEQNEFNNGMRMSMLNNATRCPAPDIDESIMAATESLNEVRAVIEKHNDVVEITEDTNSLQYDVLIENIIEEETLLATTQGWSAGNAAGIEEGKQSAYDEFWDAFQNNGKRQDYNYAFYSASGGWNNDNFKPKYNMMPTGAIQTFEGCKCVDCDFRELGIKIYWERCGSFQSTFKNFAGLTAIVINSTGYAANFDQCFYGCTGLQYLKIDVHAGLNFYANAFYNCKALTDLTITGTIGKTINLKWSPLNKASIKSVINALSKTTSGIALTLKKTAVNNAFGIDVDDETTYPEGSEYYTLRHSRDNWTFSYV